MQKKQLLSQTKQLSVLKELRRQCPFCVFNGSYGYTCGGLTGGVSVYATHFGSKSKEARRCSLGCKNLLVKAWQNGYDITINRQKLLGI